MAVLESGRRLVNLVGDGRRRRRLVPCSSNCEGKYGKMIFTISLLLVFFINMVNDYFEKWAGSSGYFDVFPRFFPHCLGFYFKT